MNKWLDISQGIVSICIGLAVGLNILGIGLGLAYSSFRKSLSYLKQDEKETKNDQN